MAVPSALEKRWSSRQHIGVILVAGFLIRLYYHIAYRPWWVGDSGGYTYAMWAWKNGYFPDGRRMPLYPLFLGLIAFIARRPVFPDMAKLTGYVAVLAQSVLVLCAAVLIYDIIRRLGVRDRLAFWGGLCFSLIGGLCEFEMIVLPQSLAIFWLILSCWFFVRAIAKLHRAESPILDAICTGLSFSAAVLVRTEMLVFFVVLLGCMALVVAFAALRRNHQAGTVTTNGRTFRQTAAITLLVMPLAAAPGIVAWMSFNYLATGQMRLTSMMGYQFYQSVYNLFDRVEPQDRAFGQIMVKHYRLTNHDGQIKRDYIWTSLNDIQLHASEFPIKRRRYPSHVVGSMKMTQHSADVLDLGNYMERVSRNLAKRNPTAWLRNAADDFVRCTFDFRYTPPEPVAEITPLSDPRSVDIKQVWRYPALRPLMLWIDRVQAPLLSALYACTIGLALLGPILLIRNNHSKTLLVDGAVLALALGTVCTFASYSLLASYYSQYGAMFLGVMVITIVYALEKLLTLRAVSLGDQPSVPMSSKGRVKVA